MTDWVRQAWFKVVAGVRRSSPSNNKLDHKTRASQLFNVNVFICKSHSASATKTSQLDI